MNGLSRRHLLALGAAAGLATVTACSPPGAAPQDSGSTTSSGGATGPDPTAGAQVRYTFPGDTQNAKDIALITAAANEMLAAKGRKYTVKLEMLDWDTFNTRTPVQLTAGSDLDGVFTAEWSNNFYSNSSSGNFTPIDGYLDTFGADLKTQLPQWVWPVVAIGDKHMAVPNQQMFPETWGVLVQKALADKYGLTADGITDYSDLTDFLTAVQKGEKGIIGVYSDSDNNSGTRVTGYDYTLKSFDLVTKADDPQGKIITIYDVEKAIANFDLMHRWRQAGFFDPTPPPTADASSKWSNKQYAVKLEQTQRSWRNTFPLLEKELFEPLTTSGAISGTLNAIARGSKHPEAVLLWFNDLFSDEALYNLVCNGIENKHWKWQDKSSRLVTYAAGVSSQNTGWHPNTDWMFGDQFKAYYWDKTEAAAKRWEVEKSLNDKSTKSTLLGWAFNPDAVQTEAAAVSGVVAERAPLHNFGMVPVSEVSVTKDRLKAAGIDALIAEAQRQVDEWLRSR